MLREREEQIRAKRDRQKREEEQKQLELELLNLQIEQQKKIREDYERKCAEEREKYRCQLIQQIREVEEARVSCRSSFTDARLKIHTKGPLKNLKLICS